MDKTSKTSYALKRMFLVLAIAAVSIVGLISCENLFKHGDTIALGLSVIQVLPYIGAVIAIIGVALFAVRRIREIPEKELTLTSYLVTFAGLTFTLSGVAINRFFPDAFGFCYVLVCALTVLYLIAYIYQQEFLVCSMLLAVGSFGFYGIYRFAGAGPVYSGGSLWLVIIAALGLAIIGAFLHFFLSKNGGRLKLGQKEFVLLHAKFEYRFAYFALALILAGLIVALLLGAVGAYYTVFGLLIAEFGLAIYFTARLM